MIPVKKLKFGIVIGFLFVIQYLACITLLFAQGGTVTLVYPKTEVYLADTNINFQWNIFQQSSAYYLQVSPDSSFASNLIINDSTINATTYSGSLLFNTTYYWHVSADTGSGFTDWSFANSFTLFAPSELNGLAIWLHADSLSLNGATVDTLWDLSGFGNDAVQSAVSSQPLLVGSDALINYKPVLNFNGSSNFMEVLDNPTVDFTTAMTIFIVARQQLLSTNEGMITKWDYNTQGSWAMQTGAGASDELTTFIANNLTDIGSNYVNSNGALLTDYKYSIICLSYDGSQAALDRIKYYRNSVELNTTVNGIITDTLQNCTASIKLGSWGGSLTRYYTGDIAEVIIYDSLLDNTSRIMVEQYLRYKYAPPVNLGPDITFNGFCDTSLSAGERFVNYQWSTGDTLDSITINQPGTYWVSVTDIFGYTSSDTIAVVYPGNINQFSSDEVICQNDTLLWDPLLDSSYVFLWQDSSSSITYNIVEGGTYYLMVTDDIGCSFYSDTISVSVDSFSTIVSLGPDDTLCSGNSISPVSGASQASSYLWTPGGETASSIQVFNSDTFGLSVIDSNGCLASDSVFITIKGEAPIPNFIVSINCLGDTIEFTDSSTAQNSSIISWTWDFGNGNFSTDTNPSNYYSTVGVYDVSLTVTTDSGCSDSVIIPVSIHPNPQADFGPLLACSNSQISFIDQSTISSGIISNWTWIIESDTINTSSANHIFQDTGAYPITLISYSDNGCPDTTMNTVSVKESPVADFSHTLNCGNMAVAFLDNSQISSPNSIFSWNWSFGDGNSSNTNPSTHTYLTNNTYNIILTVQATNGCIATYSDSVLVVPIIVNADFSGIDACYQNLHQFLDNSTAVGDSIFLWNWKIDTFETTILKDPAFTFQDSGSYLVTHYVTTEFGCEDSIVKTVIVHSLPKVDFDFVPKYGVNPGEIVNFTNNTVNANDYYWDFGDNSPLDTDVNPQHTYPSTAVYPITLVGANSYGCLDSIVKSVDVQTPLVDISISELSMECNPSIIENITINISNMGTRELTSIDLFVRVEGSDPIREQWTGFLGPKSIVSYTFNVAFPVNSKASVNYICVWAENPNNTLDENPSNNEACLACNNDFTIIDLFPNPVSGDLNIWFVLPNADYIEANIFDEKGSFIGVVFSGDGTKGLNQFSFNTSLLANGMYNIRFEYLGNSYIRSFIAN